MQNKINQAREMMEFTKLLFKKNKVKAREYFDRIEKGQDLAKRLASYKIDFKFLNQTKNESEKPNSYNQTLNLIADTITQLERELNDYKEQNSDINWKLFI